MAVAVEEAVEAAEVVAKARVAIESHLELRVPILLDPKLDLEKANPVRARQDEGAGGNWN